MDRSPLFSQPQIQINFVRPKELVDLNIVLNTVRSNLYAQINEKNVIINCPVMPIINADETQMIQLFQNLFSNAIKYNVESLPVINLSYTITGKNYQFTISDNGIGIAEEFREKIFMIFQRLHSRNESRDALHQFSSRVCCQLQVLLYWETRFFSQFDNC